MKNLFLFISVLCIIGCQNKRSSKSSNDSPTIDSINGVKFALVLQDNDSLAILGKYELNKTIYLLDNANGKLIHTSTISYNENLYPDFYKKLEATKIRIKANNNQNYIAYFGLKPNDYKLISQKPNNSQDFISDIDNLIKKSGYLDSILHNETFVKDSLKNKFPLLFKININQTDITIATYMLMNMHGPRFAIIKNNVFPLTHNTACSYDYLYTFFMNGKYFIETGSACCGCGITGKQIFEINNDSIKTIFEDFTLSD
jgi:hypothetical protein